MFPYVEVLETANLALTGGAIESSHALPLAGVPSFEIVGKEWRPSLPEPHIILAENGGVGDLVQ